jgi:hypothetical protein
MRSSGVVLMSGNPQDNVDIIAQALHEHGVVGAEDPSPLPRFHGRPGSPTLNACGVPARGSRGEFLIIVCHNLYRILAGTPQAHVMDLPLQCPLRMDRDNRRTIMNRTRSCPGRRLPP